MILISSNPLLVLSSGSRFMQVEPRLVCGDDPVVEAEQPAPLQKVLAKTPSLQFLVVCQHMRD